MQSKFGDYFKKIREENGYKTKTEFANKSGITLATISRIESNTHHPKPPTLKTISEHLRTVTYEELLFAAGYLDQIEEKEKVVDPSTDELITLLYTLDKEKREAYIETMKNMIKTLEKATSID